MTDRIHRNDCVFVADRCIPPRIILSHSGKAAYTHPHHSDHSQRKACYTHRSASNRSAHRRRSSHNAAKDSDNSAHTHFPDTPHPQDKICRKHRNVRHLDPTGCTPNHRSDPTPQHKRTHPQHNAPQADNPSHKHRNAKDVFACRCNRQNKPSVSAQDKTLHNALRCKAALPHTLLHTHHNAPDSPRDPHNALRITAALRDKHTFLHGRSDPRHKTCRNFRSVARCSPNPRIRPNKRSASPQDKKPHSALPHKKNPQHKHFHTHHNEADTLVHRHTLRHTRANPPHIHIAHHDSFLAHHKPFHTHHNDADHSLDTHKPHHTATSKPRTLRPDIALRGTPRLSHKPFHTLRNAMHLGGYRGTLQHKAVAALHKPPSFRVDKLLFRIAALPHKPFHKHHNARARPARPHKPRHNPQKTTGKHNAPPDKQTKANTPSDTDKASAHKTPRHNPPTTHTTNPNEKTHAFVSRCDPFTEKTHTHRCERT